MTTSFPALPEAQLAAAILGLRFDSADRACAEEVLAQSGWGWTAALGLVAGGGVLALRTRPGSDLNRSPVLRVHGAEAVTLCSHAACLVPMQLLSQLACDPTAFPRLSSISSRDWAGLTRIHQACGGSGALEEVRALIEDGGFRRSLAHAGLRPTALADAQELLDDDPATATWARALAAAITHEKIPDLQHAVGAWDAAVAALAFVVARCRPASPLARTEAVRAAWLMMHVPPGLDSSRSSFPEEACHPGSGRSLVLQLAAAQCLTRANAGVPDEWRTDPWWSAIRALAEAGPGYDGTEHRDLAHALGAGGAAESAWTALAAAGYWRQVSGAGRSDDLLADFRALREGHAEAPFAASPPREAPPARVVIRIEDLFDPPSPGDDPDNILDYPLLPAPPPAPAPVAPARPPRSRRSTTAGAARSAPARPAKARKRRRKR